MPSIIGMFSLRHVHISETIPNGNCCHAIDQAKFVCWLWWMYNGPDWRIAFISVNDLNLSRRTMKSVHYQWWERERGLIMRTRCSSFYDPFGQLLRRMWRVDWFFQSLEVEVPAQAYLECKASQWYSKRKKENQTIWRLIFAPTWAVKNCEDLVFDREGARPIDRKGFLLLFLALSLAFCLVPGIKFAVRAMQLKPSRPFIWSVYQVCTANATSTKAIGLFYFFPLVAKTWIRLTLFRFWHEYCELKVSFSFCWARSHLEWETWTYFHGDRCTN